MTNKNSKIYIYTKTSDNDICLWTTYKLDDGNIRGIADTIHRILWDKNYWFEEVAFTRLWLNKGDTLLQIKSFYPNWVYYREVDFKKWRGKIFLEEMYQEAITIWAKIIYTWTFSKHMKNFVQKHGFELFEQKDGMALCIKKI